MVASNCASRRSWSGVSRVCVCGVLVGLLWGAQGVGASPWTPDVRLTNDAATSEISAVAADIFGNVHVVWHDYRHGNPEIYYKRWNGVTWTSDERLTVEGATSAWPKIAADPGGNAHVVWYDYRGGDPAIYYKRWDGISWTPDERISNGPAWSVTPTVVADAVGNVHVIWYDNRDEGNCEIYYKRWDGSSWTQDERLTFDDAESRYPLTAVDHAGKLHVVWQERRDGNWEIYYKQWDGIAWTPDRRLTIDGYDSLRPCITADIDLNVHVMWYDYRDDHAEIYYKRYDGLSWTADMRLSADDSWSSSRPATAADMTGRVYVAWFDERDGLPGEEIYFKWWAGGAWSEDERATNDPADSEFPTLVPDAEGDVHLVWQDRRDGNLEIYYKRRLAPGPPGPPPTLTGMAPPIVWNFGTHDLTARGGDFRSPAIVRLITDGGDALTGTTLQVTQTEIIARFDLTGTILGEWSAVVILDDGQSDTLRNCLKTSASPWGEEWRLTSDLSGSSLANNGGRSVVLDLSQVLHLFWFDTRDGNQEIYWKSRTGDLWSIDQRLTYDGGMSSYPVAASSSLGSILVAWQETRNGNAEIYTKLRSNDVWWEDERVTSDASASLYPSATADPSGEFHLAWQDARAGNWEIYHAQTNGGAWGESVRLTFDSNSSVYPSVVSDSVGRIYVAWMDDRDGNWEIYSVRHNGTAWEPAQRITFNAATSAYPSLAVDGDEVYVVWQDDRSGNEEIYLRRINAPSTDERITFDLAASHSPMLAVTDDHALHVIWSDTRAGVQEIWYKNFLPFDGTWSLDARMSGSGTEATLGSIVVGPDYSLDVIWRDLRDGNSEIYARSRSEIATGLHDPETVGGLLRIRCSPNPCRERADFLFQVPGPERTVLRIFDVHGRTVSTLLDQDACSGLHKLSWNGIASDGCTVGNGVYFYRIESGGQSHRGRFVWVR